LTSHLEGFASKEPSSGEKPLRNNCQIFEKKNPFSLSIFQKFAQNRSICFETKISLQFVDRLIYNFPARQSVTMTFDFSTTLV